MVSVHLVSRLLVGGILFLSGYTHCTYFWLSGSVSLRRVLYVSTYYKFCAPIPSIEHELPLHGIVIIIQNLVSD